MNLIDGKKISEIVKNELKIEIEQLNQKGIYPGIAVVLVGKDPASEIYVRQKKRACEEIGIKSIEHILNANVKEEEVLKLVNSLNNDETVHGIICQLPFPSHLNETNIVSQIDPLKDVDAQNPLSQGLLSIGVQGFKPCTPKAVLEILKRENIDTMGKRVVIVGRSNTVGRPLSILLSQKEWNATVTICHSKTKDLERTCSEADILVSAIGKPNFISKEHVKNGAIVIDVGINSIIDKSKKNGLTIVGDVDFNAVLDKVSLITPVPGGVGPVTIAMLLKNSVEAAKSYL